jgi:hypothetical protein
VFQAVRGPWHRVEPFLFDRPAVHQARAEHAIVHPGQRVAHLFQHDRIAIGVGELLGRPFVGDARLADVIGRIDELSLAIGNRASDPGRQGFFEVELSRSL